MHVIVHIHIHGYMYFDIHIPQSVMQLYTHLLYTLFFISIFALPPFLPPFLFLSTPSTFCPPLSNLTQIRSALDMLQSELRSERQLRQEAEAAASKMELEVKKLKADLQVSGNEAHLRLFLPPPFSPPPSFPSSFSVSFLVPVSPPSSLSPCLSLFVPLSLQSEVCLSPSSWTQATKGMCG